MAISLKSIKDFKKIIFWTWGIFVIRNTENSNWLNRFLNIYFRCWYPKVNNWTIMLVLYFYFLIIRNQEILKHSIRLLRYPYLIRIWNHLIRKNLISKWSWKIRSDQIGFKISVRSDIFFRTLNIINSKINYSLIKAEWLMCIYAYI